MVLAHNDQRNTHRRTFKRFALKFIEANLYSHLSQLKGWHFPFFVHSNARKNLHICKKQYEQRENEKGNEDKKDERTKGQKGRQTSLVNNGRMLKHEIYTKAHRKDQIHTLCICHSL